MAGLAEFLGLDKFSSQLNIGAKYGKNGIEFTVFTPQSNGKNLQEPDFTNVANDLLRLAHRAVKERKKISKRQL